MYETDLKNTIEENFKIYAGMVCTDRALCDVRDCLKPAARQLMYSQFEQKIIHSKPFQKSSASIGNALRDYYIHGDTSAYGTLARLAKPFVMRYPLEDFKGGYGTITQNGGESHYRYCVTGDTLITTEKGLIPINQIVKSTPLNSDNQFETLKVQGIIGSNDSKVLFNSGIHPTYKITLSNGMSIGGTGNHPLLILNSNLDFTWKTIDELNEGDKVLLSLPQDSIYFGDNDNLLEAKMLGIFISEGYILPETNRIGVNNLDLEYITPFYDYFKEKGFTGHINDRKKDFCYEICVSKKDIYDEFINNFECTKNYAINKKIPNTVLKGTKEYQKTFLSYLFEGDGSICENGNIVYSSISSQLIDTLQIMLANFGISSYRTLQQGRNEIKLNIGSYDMRIFMEKINFVSDRKKEVLSQRVKKYEEINSKKLKYRDFPEGRDFIYNLKIKGITKRISFITNLYGLPLLKEKLSNEIYSKIEYLYKNFLYLPIVKKESTGEKEVYSLRIDDDSHAYITNGFISHNTEMRTSELAGYLFNDLDKGTIHKWFDNFDNTKQYPSVLPSMGFYNIVNGTLGIGVALASSIPQFNLTEVNNALIYLLNNPEATFEELYCAPDFATGGFLINEKEIKESLKTGNGKACKIRSAIDYDSDENCLIVSEIPYGVYTNTIAKQMAESLEKGELIGVDSFIDLTKKEPNIKIKLTKTANPSKIIQNLYKNTSLQYYYGINMVMLENGTNPKVFGWKDALSAHLIHEKEVLRNSLEFDLNKYKSRLHIVEGLLIALANIEDIIQTIKNSNDSASARISLMEKYNFSELQARAILDIKLVRLASLEAVKIENEKKDILTAIAEIENILSTESIFNKIIEDKLKEVIKKFGDKRRTQILNISVNENGEDEPVEKKSMIVHLTNKGNLYAFESIMLTTQRRGGKGIKIKTKDEAIVETISNQNDNNGLFFSNKGKVYMTMLDNIPLNTKVPPQTLFELEANERITNIISLDRFNEYQYILFITKQGLIKKTKLEEYRIKKTKGINAIKLKDNDEVSNILFTNEEKIGILTNDGHFIIINSSEINPIGRMASGVIGIKLNNDDFVIDSKIIPTDTKEIISISKSGLIKRTLIDEFTITNRGAKGSFIQRFKEDDSAAAFNTLIGDEKEITITSNTNIIKFSLDEVQCSSKDAIGTNAKKFNDNEYITDIIKVVN